MARIVQISIARYITSKYELMRTVHKSEPVRTRLQKDAIHTFVLGNEVLKFTIEQQENHDSNVQLLFFSLSRRGRGAQRLVNATATTSQRASILSKIAEIAVSKFCL